MTSQPDVQNVPDIWGLLQKLRKYVHSDEPDLNTLDAALAQRDRFVLVPKEPRNVSEALHMIREHQTQIARLQQYVLGDPRESVVVAAAPKPPEKP